MSKSKKLPFMKWYPSDWQGAPELKLCSWESRYLWLELLHLMHASEKRGYLLKRGRPWTEEELAEVISKASPQRIKDCLFELESHAVFSRNRVGVIYCRKMVSDEKRAENLKKKPGKKGQPENDDETKTEDKSEINSSYFDENDEIEQAASDGNITENMTSEVPKRSIPEARVQKLDNKLSIEDNLFDDDKPKKSSVCRLEKYMAKNFPEHPADLPTEWGHVAMKIANDYRPGTSLDLKKLILFQWDRFFDFWKSRSGANASKADWLAAWRNWWRGEFEKYAEKEERDVRFQERFAK